MGVRSLLAFLRRRRTGTTELWDDYVDRSAEEKFARWQARLRSQLSWPFVPTAAVGVDACFWGVDEASLRVATQPGENMIG